MKYLILILLFSCSTPVITTLYSSDSNGQYKCEPISLLMKFDFENADEDMSKYGYSDCKIIEKSVDTISRECKSPTHYKLITTTNMAKCHKFMKEIYP